MDFSDFKSLENDLGLNVVSEPSWYESITMDSVTDSLLGGFSIFNTANETAVQSKNIWDNFGKSPEEIQREHVQATRQTVTAPISTAKVNNAGVTNKQMMLIGGGLLAVVLLLK